MWREGVVQREGRRETVRSDCFFFKTSQSNSSGFCFFFSLLARLPVDGKPQTSTLGPLDCAIDELQRKIEDLRTAASGVPNLVLLQLQLQGALSVQVNRGPLEYARVFLDSANNKAYDSSKIQVPSAEEERLLWEGGKGGFVMQCTCPTRIFDLPLRPSHFTDAARCVSHLHC